ncbi:hypothetical protein ACH5RR_029670 [Cinchona calisaya]|uniref:Uncharacterized protein n=1 Tax=Cinchona calisaya TaxID=153742 RepID=A0ABD2YSB5_9GENT
MKFTTNFIKNFEEWYGGSEDVVRRLGSNAGGMKRMGLGKEWYGGYGEEAERFGVVAERNGGGRGRRDRREKSRLGSRIIGKRRWSEVTKRLRVKGAKVEG